MTDPVLGTERPAVHLYASDGTTFISDLTTARNIQWLHELSKPGTASFEIPLADAGDIADRCIVKFSWKGAIRFGVRITSEQCSLAVDGTRWVKFDNQPGLLSLLSDAVVYPENGLNRRSAQSRSFGYMSKDGDWRDPTEWVTPQTAAFGGGTHGPNPKALLPYDRNWFWIGYTDPDTSQPVDTVNFFRKTFTLTDAADLVLITSADNFGDVYIDNEQVVTADRTGATSWFNAQFIPLRLDAGDHLIAAKCQNTSYTWTPPGALNPMAFMATLMFVDGNGQPIRDSFVIHTDDTWEVSSGVPEPGWGRAWVLHTLVTEAQDRGVLGPSLLTMDFDVTQDSDSVTWSDRGEFTFDVGTVNLSDIATQLAESLVDFDVAADTMTLQAWNRRGSDLSATVELQLGEDDGTLMSYDTTRTTARFTSVLTQLADGTWIDTLDTAGVSATGLIEVGLNIGSTSSLVTAANVARAQLAESAAILVSSTAKPSVLEGALPYVDYSLGDSITVPAHRADGTMRARVLSITVDGSGDTVQAWPEFVIDNS